MDINETLADMLGAIKGATLDTWPEVKSIANQFMQDRKERLELLADFRIKNQITDADLKSRLEDEKNLLEAELHTIAIVSKVVAQNAANAAIDVLQKAIMAAVKAL